MGAVHHHGHDHDHGPADFNRAFLIGIVLNTLFVAVEAGYGFAANSMALLADAGHNLGDVLGLVVAWIGARLVQRRASPRFTYGLKKSSILAALINALNVDGYLRDSNSRLGETRPHVWRRRLS